MIIVTSVDNAIAINAYQSIECGIHRHRHSDGSHYAA